MRLRSALNPEQHLNLIEGPTRYRRGPNQLQILCGFCNEGYYVDDATFRQALRAMKEGLDNPFCCGQCEEDNEELAH